MSGSCCGVTKSEMPKIEMKIAHAALKRAAAELAAKSEKSGCCNDKPSMVARSGCGC